MGRCYTLGRSARGGGNAWQCAAPGDDGWRRWPAWREVGRASIQQKLLVPSQTGRWPLLLPGVNHCLCWMSVLALPFVLAKDCVLRICFSWRTIQFCRGKAHPIFKILIFFTLDFSLSLSIDLAFLPLFCMLDLFFLLFVLLGFFFYMNIKKDKVFKTKSTVFTRSLLVTSSSYQLSCSAKLTPASGSAASWEQHDQVCVVEGKK